MIRAVRGETTVGLVGAGVIGLGWAAHFLRQGFNVVATDPDPQALDGLRRSVQDLWPQLERLGLRDGAKPERLRTSTQPSILHSDTSVIFENAPEDLRLKQQILADLDRVCAPEVVLASSSSSLRPTELQRWCERHPERVLVAHPFHPPHIVPLVEIVGGLLTSATVIKDFRAFMLECDKSPIVLDVEVPGHVANRLQAALWREAYSLVAAGVTSVSDIELAISAGPGLRWALAGPFATLHMSGGAGGIDHIHEHLGSTMVRLWEDEVVPDLTVDLQHRVSTGVSALEGASDPLTMARQRDAALIDLIGMRHREEAERRGD